MDGFPWEGGEFVLMYQKGVYQYLGGQRWSVEEPTNWPLIFILSVFLLLTEVPVFSWEHGSQARNSIFQLPLNVGHIAKFWPKKISLLIFLPFHISCSVVVNQI